MHATESVSSTSSKPWTDNEFFTENSGPGFAPLPSRLFQYCGWILLLGSLSISLGVLLRRLSGAFDHPPSSGLFLIVWGLFVGMVLGGRFLRRNDTAINYATRDLDLTKGNLLLSSLRKPRLLIWEGFLWSFSLLVFFLALSLPDIPLWCWGIGWSMLIAEEFLWWSWGRHLHVIKSAVDFSLPVLARPVSSPVSIERVLPTQIEGYPAENVTTSTIEVEDDECEEETENSVFNEKKNTRLVQELQRYISPQGLDSLRGDAGLILEPGQKTAYLHLAFCPPFAKTPHLEWKQITGPTLRAKVGQLVPWGVRLDIKLTESPEKYQEVRFLVLASCEANPSENESLRTL